MGVLWTEQFRPSLLEGFIGNSDIRQQAVKWGEEWENGSPQKPLLLYGQTGVGKTLLAYLLANHFSWQVFESSGSDFRDKDTIERIVSQAASNSTLSGAKRLVLLDEIDCLSSVDRGGAQAILKILKESKNPVILTANDIYADKKLAALRTMCTVLEFRKINYLSIAKHLRGILSRQSVAFGENAVTELAKLCEGDMRAALLDLQTLALSQNVSIDGVKSLGERERQQKVFKVMAKIFHGKTFEEIREAIFYSDLNQEMLFNWVEENIPSQYQGNDIAVAFDYLSRADRFNGRIYSRQYYGFMRYSGDLMALGVNVAKSREYNSFTPFRFPSLLSKLSRSISEREMKKSISRKIGQKTHSSFRKVMAQDLPFYTQLIEDKENARAFFDQFALEPEEIAFLLDAKVDSKKVKEFTQKEEKPQIEKPAKHKSHEKIPKEADLPVEDEQPKQAKLF